MNKTRDANPVLVIKRNECTTSVGELNAVFATRRIQLTGY